MAITNYAECSTNGNIAAKTASITNFKLITGARVLIKFTHANTASSPSLNVSGTGAKFITLYGTASMGVGITTTGWADGAIVPFTYDGTYWVRDYWENTISPEYIPRIYSKANSKLKQATCANYNKEANRYFLLLNPLANTATGELTLSINGSDASPIYVNGTRSGASDDSTATIIPAGLYLVYYDGTNYRLNTNGEFPGGKFDDYLPRTAGQDFPLTGPLGLTNTTNYGTTLPTTGFEGQLFFLDSNENDPVYFRGSTTATSATNRIKIPTEIAQNLKDNSLLQVYQNGILLSPADNYTISNDKVNLTLAANCNSNDIFSFILVINDFQGLDTSIYATREYVNSKTQDMFSNKYLEKAGGTISGTLTVGGAGNSALTVTNGIGCASLTATGEIHGNKVYGSVQNDYAEYRICDCLEPGRIVCENGDDTLSIATERLQPGANIVSDTFGFAIGETNEAKCPIAVSGRVLAYTWEPRGAFNAGDAVCSGPNGTVSRMTRKEIQEYPERIIGTVSAVPTYEYWGTENVAVNGRIWIKVR